ncbi:MAG: hypothetical protein JJE30_02845 [Desulfuromonadales bacterium]|nr:hypothetical protein [Desulfuromonadales bacterium]
MKSKPIAMWICLVALLFISTVGFAAPNSVSVGVSGITFPDNSVQSKAAVLPGCTSGGVLVNISGAWLCGTVMPISNGIATCVGSVCAVSACLPGLGNCDGNLANGCETALTSTLNCGACGNTCAASQSCVSGVCQPAVVQPALAIVKVRTTGTLPVGTTIGGVNAIVSATPSVGLTIAPSDISASGAGTGSIIVDNTSNVASINVAIVNTGGIQAGEIATLTYHVAAGTFPTASNFIVALTGGGVIDTNSVKIPGIGVSILSVTIQ